MCDCSSVNTPHDRAFDGMGDTLQQKGHMCTVGLPSTNTLEIEMNSLAIGEDSPIFA